jgi:two-component system, LytTR family, sensor kinase
MKKRLYLTALISAPILALYGSSPFYIFDKIALKDFVFLNIGLTINILITWCIYIFFIIKFPKLNRWWVFVISYIFNVIFRLLSLLLPTPLDMPKPTTVIESYIAYPILTSLAINGIILIICNSIIVSFKKIKADQEIQELKLQNSEAQKQALLQQLQPHFLFNALGNLKSLISINATDAENYTVKLSEFLRYAVEAQKNDLVTVIKELEFTKDYMELQKVRFDNSFTYTINVDTSSYKHQLPALAIQTLVENIFKHNFFTEKKPMHFSITYLDGYIIVQNKKTSIKITDRTKTGLKNLDMRYQLIMDKSIIVEDTEEHFTVSIPTIKGT